MTQDAPIDMLQTAKNVVESYVSEKLDKSDPDVEFSAYIVWFSKTLQNWKALVSTTLPDQMYYELTYNGERSELYLDAYKKFENRLYQVEEIPYAWA